jgi:acyl carrier protein
MTELRQKVYQAIASLLEDKSIEVTDEMPLIGDDSLLDSMRLVELCLQLEDIAADNGFEFDWTSATAMSRSRGMFRTAGALADEFSAQLQTRK